MGHAGAPSCSCVGVEQVVRAHHGEARVDDATLALLDLVHGGLHVVVDAAARNATECGEAARVRVEQHLVALARVGHPLQLMANDVLRSNKAGVMRPCHALARRPFVLDIRQVDPPVIRWHPAEHPGMDITV